MKTYDEFKDYVCSNIMRYLPESYAEAEVLLHPVMKNNGKALTGLIVRTENVGPLIYLEGYYEKYLDSKDIGMIMGMVSDVIQTYAMQKETDIIDMITDYNSIRDQIVLRVVNKNQNEKLLQSVPHTIKEDLAFIYCIKLSMDNMPIGNMVMNKDTEAVVRITNALQEKYGITTQELHSVAMENSQKMLPLRIRTLSEMILEAFPFDLDSSEYRMFQEMAEETPKEQELYVVGNLEKQHGAAALFYPGATEAIAKELGGSFFVLPSSIHEMLVIRDNCGCGPEELRQMVKEINHSEVAPEEKLSDNIYHYDSNKKQLQLVKEEKQMTMHMTRGFTR